MRRTLHIYKKNKRTFFQFHSLIFGIIPFLGLLLSSPHWLVAQQAEIIPFTFYYNNQPYSNNSFQVEYLIQRSDSTIYFPINNKLDFRGSQKSEVVVRFSQLKLDRRITDIEEDFQLIIKNKRQNQRNGLVAITSPNFVLSNKSNDKAEAKFKAEVEAPGLLYFEMVVDVTDPNIKKKVRHSLIKTQRSYFIMGATEKKQQDDGYLNSSENTNGSKTIKIIEDLKQEDRNSSEYLEILRLLTQYLELEYEIKKRGSQKYTVILKNTSQPQIDWDAMNNLDDFVINDKNLLDNHFFEVEIKSSKIYTIPVVDEWGKRASINLDNILSVEMLEKEEAGEKYFDFKIAGGHPPYEINWIKAGNPYSSFDTEKFENGTFRISEEDLIDKELAGRFEVQVKDAVLQVASVTSLVLIQPPFRVPFLVWGGIGLLLGFLAWAWGIKKFLRTRSVLDEIAPENEDEPVQRIKVQRSKD